MPVFVSVYGEPCATQSVIMYWNAYDLTCVRINMCSIRVVIMVQEQRRVGNEEVL